MKRLLSIFAFLFIASEAFAAARFLVTGGNGNWTSTTNWSATSGGASGSSAPVAGDDVTFDINSGAANITTDTSARACATFTVTVDYTGTLTMTNTLTTTAGLTLGANMTIAGTAALILSSTQTITSNGKAVPTLQLSAGSITVTLGDSLTVLGNVSLLATNTSPTLNGNTLTIGGSLNMSTTTGNITGTTNIVLNGTGTVSMTAVTSGTLRNNIEINTAGTITLSGPIRYQTGIFKYTAGTVVATDSTLSVTAAATITVDGSGLTLGGVVFGPVAITVNGSNGFTMASFLGSASLTTGNVIHTLQSGNTYTITKSFVVYSPSSLRLAIVASTPSTPFFLNYTGNAMALSYCNATDVDSSGGNPIYVYQGTLLRTTNWTAGTAIGTGGCVSGGESSQVFMQ